MRIDSWVTLWKIVFVTAFCAWMFLTLIVSVKGWRDVLDMLRALGGQAGPPRGSDPDET